MSQRKVSSSEEKNRGKNSQRNAPQQPTRNRKESAGKKQADKSQKSDGQKPPLKKFKSRSNMLKSLISNLGSAKLKSQTVVEKIDEVEEVPMSPHARKTRSEDPNFNAPRVPKLLDLCVDSLAHHFPKNTHLLRKTPKEFQKKIVSKLPLDLPLFITANTVEFDGYWKEKCRARWRACDPRDHGHSWKKTYLEKNLQEEMENFIPDISSIEDLTKTVTVSSNHIERLEILQILPKGLSPNWKESSTIDMNNSLYVGRFSSKSGQMNINSSVEEDEDVDLDHLNFSEVLPLLPELKELHLRYSVRKCGIEFHWNYFRISETDCTNLAKCLQLCQGLEHLAIRSSKLKDSGTKILCNQLKHHKSLKSLDLSHNVLTDVGARAISSSLLERKQAGSGGLEELDLTNNVISTSGGQSLAKGLADNSTLKRLELRLNRLGDEAGSEIMKSLEGNKGVKYLGLAGNFLGDQTTKALCSALESNVTLKVIDLSCNKLGEANGELIYLAMQSCSSITSMDLRETDIGKELEYLIAEICDNNSDS